MCVKTDLFETPGIPPDPQGGQQHHPSPHKAVIGLDGPSQLTAVHLRHLHVYDGDLIRVVFIQGPG